MSHQEREDPPRGWPGGSEDFARKVKPGGGPTPSSKPEPGDRQADDLELPPSLKRDKPTTGRKAHPLADIFPMMSDDELADLAADIKTNGLVHPIVVGADDVVIDGRNRLKACEIAGVEPQFVKLTGQDPVAFILAMNVNRRHLTAGQRAMATAFLYPEPGKRGRYAGQDEGSKSAETAGFSSRRLREARQVLRASRSLAEAVLAGTTPLDKAMEETREAVNNLASDQEALARIKAEAPDLGDLIEQGRLSLAAAKAELQDRERKIHEILEGGRKAAERLFHSGGDVAIVATAAGAGGKFITDELLERLEKNVADLKAIREALS